MQDPSLALHKKRLVSVDMQKAVPTTNDDERAGWNVSDQRLGKSRSGPAAGRP
jgi:hypothetical protein